LAIVLAKVGDRLVIRRKPAGQPHHFEITLALALEAAARLHAIEIAIHIQLESDARVIARPSEVECLDLETQLIQVERVDKRIDDANRIVAADPIIQASRQQ
jgi:hypothetical protein